MQIEDNSFGSFTTDCEGCAHLAKMTLNTKENKRSLVLRYVKAFLKDTSNLSANQTCPSVLFRNFDLKFFTLATWLFLENFSVFLF